MQVTAIGGATIDVVVAGASWAGNAGAKQDVESITMGVGGGAVNASLAMTACAAQVRIVCAVGGDAEAEWMRGVLGSEGIDLSLVQSVGCVPTGKAVIHLDANADVRVFAQRGASTRVSPSRAVDAIGRSELLYITALSGQAEEELATALQRLGHRPPTLAINPGMHQFETFTPSLSRLLSQASLISVNEAEARVWATRQGLVPPEDLALSAEAWIEPLRQCDRQAVLVTMGKRGALFHDGKQVHHMSARQVKVRSTLGAGDAFAATMACYWAAGQPAAVALDAAAEHCSRVLRVAAANLASTA